MEAQTSPSKSHKHKNTKTKKRKTTTTTPTTTITTTLNTKTIYEQPETKNPPILGYNPSGFDPLTHNNTTYDLKFYRNQLKNKSKRVELVAKLNGVGVDYVGSSYSGEGATSSLSSYALAVVHKSSQQFTLVPVTSCKVLRLSPLARASQVSDKEPETPAKIDTLEEKRLKTDELTSRYGTKTAKNKDLKARRLKPKEDPSSLAELNEVIENAAVEKSALKGPTSDISRDVPPHDLSADTPGKAYLLDKIILKGEWDYVNDVLEVLELEKEIQSDVYPSFVCNRFYKLELLKDDVEKRRLGGILSYISHLINFKNRNSLDGRSSSSSKRTKFLPGILSQKFTTMFVDPDKNRLADDKIHSLIGYVLVLTLFIDEFETDFRDIANDLKMQPLALRPYFLNLGCHFRNRNNVTLAILSAPLKFPTMRKRKTRG